MFKKKILLLLITVFLPLSSVYANDNSNYINGIVYPESEAYDDEKHENFVNSEYRLMLEDYKTFSNNLARISSKLTIIHYLQDDPRWVNKQLGNCSSETIGSAGCALTSVTMVYNYLSGSQLTPLEMNNKIMGSMCAMNWTKAADLLNITYAKGVYSGLTYDKLYNVVKENVDLGYPVIVRVCTSNNGTHYVVANGYNSTGKVIYMKDPSTNKTELSSYLNNGWTLEEYHIFTD